MCDPLSCVLDAVKDQNLDLKEEKKEIEERLWNLEMMMKKQNFSRNIILISNSPETISTTSSGFISNTSQSEQGWFLQSFTVCEFLTSLIRRGERTAGAGAGDGKTVRPAGGDGDEGGAAGGGAEEPAGGSQAGGEAAHQQARRGGAGQEDEEGLAVDRRLRSRPHCPPARYPGGGLHCALIVWQSGKSFYVAICCTLSQARHFIPRFVASFATN